MRQKQRKTRRMKELSPEAAARVLAVIADLVHDEGTRTAAAKRIGISQPSLSNLLAKKNAPSYKTAEMVALAVGSSVWTLIGEPPPAVSMPRDTTHPNLVDALEIVGARCSAMARQRVLAAAAYLPDLAVSTWSAVLLDPAHEEKR
jgi:transcriptional regulator with XRE-family HTH domain